jgi:hypothetical protein
MIKLNDAPNAAQAFSGLKTFAKWWTKFEASHCKGIKVTWTVNADLRLQLRFERGRWKWQHTIDLTDSDWDDELLKLDVGLLKLRNVPIARLNESES